MKKTLNVIILTSFFCLNFFLVDNSAPPVNMTIHRVYGYRCYDTRNNIKIDSEKNVVYHVAALGIVQKQGGGL